MASATPLSSASGSGGLPADVAALFETFAGKPQAPIKFYEKNAASKHSHVAHGVLHCSNAAQMTWMRPPTFQTCCWGRSTRRPALSEPIKLPSEAHIQRWALVSCLGRLWQPASHPTSPFFCGNCAHFIKYALASVQMREMAPSAAGSAPGGCPANALAQAVARSAQAPPSRC